MTRPIATLCSSLVQFVDAHFAGNFAPQVRFCSERFSTSGRLWSFWPAFYSFILDTDDDGVGTYLVIQRLTKSTATRGR